MSARGSNQRQTSLLSRDVGRAASTVDQDSPAISLFNYFLTEIMGLPPIEDMDLKSLEEDAENILTGYSNYICNTNIPHNHKQISSDRNVDPSNGYMKYTGLKEYLSKALNLLKKMVPDSEFWKDDDAVKDISGASFAKACKRAQTKKDYTFGQESKIGLYRASKFVGESTGRATHWVHMLNCQ